MQRMKIIEFLELSMIIIANSQLASMPNAAKFAWVDRQDIYLRHVSMLIEEHIV